MSQYKFLLPYSQSGFSVSVSNRWLNMNLKRLEQVCISHVYKHFPSNFEYCKFYLQYLVS